MDATNIILRNFPHNELHDELSFLSRLHGEQLWNTKEYQLLEWAIYCLEKDSSKNLDWEVFKIFSCIMSMIISHFDNNDYFQIRNVKLDELYDLRERVQLVFEGYFSKSMPNQNFFEGINPLLENSFKP